LDFSRGRSGTRRLAEAWNGSLIGADAASNGKTAWWAGQDEFTTTLVLSGWDEGEALLEVEEGPLEESMGKVRCATSTVAARPVVVPRAGHSWKGRWRRLTSSANRALPGTKTRWRMREWKTYRPKEIRPG
jgi:hypothetical protein